MSRPFLVRQVVAAWVASLALGATYLAVGALVDDAASGRGPAAGAVLLGTAGIVVSALAGAWVVAAGAEHAAWVDRTLRGRIVAAVVRSGPSLRTREQTGRIVSTATDASERVGTYRGTFLGPFIASLTLPLLVLGVVALTIDPGAAGLMLVAVPLVPLVIGGVARLFSGASARYRVAARRTAAAFLDSIQGLTALRLARAGGRRADTLARVSEDLRRSVMRMLAGNQVIILIGDCVFWLGFVALATWLAVERVAAGVVTPGQGVALVLLSTLLLDPLERIGAFFYLGMAGRASEKEIAGFVAQAPQETGADDSAATSSAGGAGRTGREGMAITLRDVGYHYPGSEHPVLTGVDLHVAPGERIGLVGPSGAGKSTLTDLLLGLARPTQGQVLLGDDATDALDDAALRARVTAISQTTYLFTGTIAENLRLAAPDADDARLWDALRTAALADEVAAFPQGLDTPVGERGLSLSGGQAQRVAIARAVLRDTPVLVLDEPTAQIDVASERVVVAALAELARGRTVITVSHRAGALEGVDRVVELSGGRVVEGVRR